MEMSPLIPKAKDSVITLDYVRLVESNSTMEYNNNVSSCKFQGTYAIPAGQSEVTFSGMGGKGGRGGGGDDHDGAGGAGSPSGDDEEESMDWWTKYFASVDAMIEVSCVDVIVVVVVVVVAAAVVVAAVDAVVVVVVPVVNAAVVVAISAAVVNNYAAKQTKDDGFQLPCVPVPACLPTYSYYLPIL